MISDFKQGILVFGLNVENRELKETRDTFFETWTLCECYIDLFGEFFELQIWLIIVRLSCHGTVHGLG